MAPLKPIPTNNLVSKITWATAIRIESKEQIISGGFSPAFSSRSEINDHSPLLGDAPILAALSVVPSLTGALEIRLHREKTASASVHCRFHLRLID